MKNPIILVIAAVLSIFTVGCSKFRAGSGEVGTAELLHVGNATKILVFTRTQAFRHGSIEDGAKAITQLMEKRGLKVVQTEDPTIFNHDSLEEFKAVVFLSTTGDFLNDVQQKAFEEYIEGGGGYVGIHAASDGEYSDEKSNNGWVWYGKLVGAYFKNHPAIQEAEVDVLDRDHPSTKHLPQRWKRSDEWYNFQASPRGNVHVLATLNERSYAPAHTDSNDRIDKNIILPDHPISWCHNVKSGRSFYTGMGHTSESYTEDAFLGHLDGGIAWAAGLEEGECSATVNKNFVAKTLANNFVAPMEMKIMNDGRVIVIERAGKVKIYDPKTAATTVAASLEVYSDLEDGLLGVALDPNFDSNHWVYLYYSDKNQLLNRLSRFTLEGSKINMGTERMLLEIPVEREQCCHAGGSLTFGPNNTLFLSAGDNTNPWESDGFSPTDSRPGRTQFDASRSAGNTNDLRGKILRIVPTESGEPRYTIPAGNLFPVGTAKTRPEIYAMGLRNPFRISVDQRRGWLFWGDVGPDSGEDIEGRGRKGKDEVNLAKAPGNFGWPFVNGPNEAYWQYNFETKVGGPQWDLNGPMNLSPNNTGLQKLPPAMPSWIYYYYDTPAFIEMDPMPENPEEGTNGKTAMAGPLYYYDPQGKEPTRFPKYYDGTVFVYDWSRNLIREVKMDDSGGIVKISPFRAYDAEKLNTKDPYKYFQHPIDMEMGPDGRMYVLTFGPYWSGDGGVEAQLVRVDYVGSTDVEVVAKIEPSKTNGPVPLTVQFSSAGSADPINGGGVSGGASGGASGGVTYAWDFDGDGTTDSTEANPSHVFNEAGDPTVTLTVTSKADRSRTGRASVVINAGNTAPTVEFLWPLNGGFFDFGDKIPYEIKVDDEEDKLTGGINYKNWKAEASLGHDGHSHGLSGLEKLKDVYQTVTDTGHAPTDEVYYGLSSRYIDKGAPGASLLETRTAVRLNPRRTEVEFYKEKSGMQLESVGANDTGYMALAFIYDGNWVMFDPMNFYGINEVRYRVSSNSVGGTIEMRLDSPDGRLVTTATVPASTGGWQSWQTISASMQDPVGTHKVYFVFRGPKGVAPTEALFNVNWIQFVGPGITVRPDGTGSPQPVDTGAIVNEMKKLANTDELTFEQWNHYYGEATKHEKSGPATGDVGINEDTRYKKITVDKWLSVMKAYGHL